MICHQRMISIREGRDCNLLEIVLFFMVAEHRNISKSEAVPPMARAIAETLKPHLKISHSLTYLQVQVECQFLLQKAFI